MGDVLNWLLSVLGGAPGRTLVETHPTLPSSDGTAGRSPFTALLALELAARTGASEREAALEGDGAPDSGGRQGGLASLVSSHPQEESPDAPAPAAPAFAAGPWPLAPGAETFAGAVLAGLAPLQEARPLGHDPPETSARMAPPSATPAPSQRRTSGAPAALPLVEDVPWPARGDGGGTQPPAPGPGPIAGGAAPTASPVEKRLVPEATRAVSAERFEARPAVSLESSRPGLGAGIHALFSPSTTPREAREAGGTNARPEPAGRAGGTQPHDDGLPPALARLAAGAERLPRGADALRWPRARLVLAQTDARAEPIRQAGVPSAKTGAAAESPALEHDPQDNRRDAPRAASPGAGKLFRGPLTRLSHGASLPTWRDGPRVADGSGKREKRVERGVERSEQTPPERSLRPDAMERRPARAELRELLGEARGALLRPTARSGFVWKAEAHAAGSTAAHRPPLTLQRPGHGVFHVEPPAPPERRPAPPPARGFQASERAPAPERGEAGRPRAPRPTQPPDREPHGRVKPSAPLREAAPVETAASAWHAARAASGPAGSGQPAAPSPIPDHEALIRTILARARLLAPEGAVELRFRLEPPELGALRVRLHARGEHVRVEIVVQQAHALEGLRAAVSRLEQQLHQAGFREAEVWLAHGGSRDFHEHRGSPGEDEGAWYGPRGASRVRGAAPSTPASEHASETADPTARLNRLV